VYLYQVYTMLVLMLHRVRQYVVISSYEFMMELSAAKQQRLRHSIISVPIAIEGCKEIIQILFFILLCGWIGYHWFHWCVTIVRIL